MAVMKRSDSAYWQFEFEFKGKRYRGSTGKTNKAEAQAFEVDRRREVKEDAEKARLGVKRSTLKGIADEWLKSSAETHRDHKNNVGRVRKLFGHGLEKQGDQWVEVRNVRFGLPEDLPVHEVTQALLIELRNKRREEGNSVGTINIEFSLLQSLMGYALASGVVMPAVPIVWSQKRNRAASLKLPPPPGKLRWLRKAEADQLLLSLSAVVDERPKDQSAIDAYHLTMFLMDTGARHTEISEIRWDMIDLERGTIDLYRGKVGNESVLTLPTRTWGMLRARWETMKGLGYSYVFPALNGRRWAGTTNARGHATGSIQRHIDLLGLNDNPKESRVTPHTFRDTFASWLVQAGVSLLKVSHLLGHADESMTKKYAHLCPDATGREAANVLDAMHGDAPTQGDDLNAARLARMHPHKVTTLTSAIVDQDAPTQGDDLNADAVSSPHVSAHGGVGTSQQLTSQTLEEKPQVIDSQGVFIEVLVGRTGVEPVTHGLKEPSPS